MYAFIMELPNGKKAAYLKLVGFQKTPSLMVVRTTTVTAPSALDSGSFRNYACLASSIDSSSYFHNRTRMHYKYIAMLNIKH